MNQTNRLEVVLQRLTPLQQKVAAMLLQGSTVKGAAEENGLHRTTVHTWCRTNPTFQLALQEARRMQAAWLADETQIIAAQVMAQLSEFLHDDKINASVRLRAALAIIDRAARKGEAPAEEAVGSAEKAGALRKMLRGGGFADMGQGPEGETVRRVGG